MDRTVAFIKEEAKGRSTPLELHALVQTVIVIEDWQGAADDIARRGWTPTSDDALNTPFLAIGTHSEIADHLRACRERWGISYFSVRDIDAFAPVIQRLKDRQNTAP